jgi:hypothetical protein
LSRPGQRKWMQGDYVKLAHLRASYLRKHAIRV